MNATELHVLKCQAAQAKMIIARNQRKYQDFMDTLSQVDTVPQTKAELLAAELQDLQRRKIAALQGDDEETFDEDDVDSEDEDDEEMEGYDAVPEAVPVSDDIPIYARPLTGRRNPWDISIAEPIVMDALLRHQDKAIAKVLSGVNPPPREVAETAIETDRPQEDKPHGNDGGALFVMTAVEHGLQGFAPFIFNYYGTPSAQTDAKASLTKPKPRRCVYSDSQVDTSSNNDDTEFCLDPHRLKVDSLEACLTDERHVPPPGIDN